MGSSLCPIPQGTRSGAAAQVPQCWLEMGALWVPGAAGCVWCPSAPTAHGAVWGGLCVVSPGAVWGALSSSARPQNLLRVGSALLDASNKRHWELIQQTEGGTAMLLKHFEDYASALAQNMRQTYLSPFTIVTPNIGECNGGRCPLHPLGCVCAWGRGSMHTWGPEHRVVPLVTPWCHCSGVSGAVGQGQLCGCTAATL